VTVSQGNESERELGEMVSGIYVQVLGGGAAVGRVLTADDDKRPGGHPVTVLAFDYWQSRFNGDPKVVGQKILINSYPIAVVGVSAARAHPDITEGLWIFGNKSISREHAQMIRAKRSYPSTKRGISGWRS